jgi:RimJ/RimL family protein N-acetyltransferase
VMEQGHQIGLRDWQLADIDEFRRWELPGQAWQKWDAPYEPAPTQEQIEQRIARLAEAIRYAQWATPRQRIAIVDRQTERLLGNVSWYWQSEATHWLCVGIVIYDPSHWRRGIGYEALGLWCQYLWQAFPQIVRLGLATWSGHRGMMRLAEKLGFQMEARYRKARIVEGKYYDSVGYGILREEWQMHYPDGFG